MNNAVSFIIKAAVNSVSIRIRDTSVKTDFLGNIIKPIRNFIEYS